MKVATNITFAQDLSERITDICVVLYSIAYLALAAQFAMLTIKSVIVIILGRRPLQLYCALPAGAPHPLLAPILSTAGRTFTNPGHGRNRPAHRVSRGREQHPASPGGGSSSLLRKSMQTFHTQ